MSFEELWDRLQQNLAVGTTVQHWSVFRGDLKGEFEITSIEPESIRVSSTNQPIPKNDFRVVAELWDDYCAGNVPRFRIRDLTRFSTYIISVLHWQEKCAPLGSLGPTGQPEEQRSSRLVGDKKLFCVLTLRKGEIVWDTEGSPPPSLRTPGLIRTSARACNAPRRVVTIAVKPRDA